MENLSTQPSPTNLEINASEGRWQRPVRKMIKHIDDALFHLQNVKGISDENVNMIASRLFNARKILEHCFGEEK